MKVWLRRRRTLIPVHEIGGVTVIERKTDSGEILGYQMAIMVDHGILPIHYGPRDENEVEADLSAIQEAVEGLKDYD